MKRKLLTGIAVVGVALAVAAGVAFAHGPQFGYGPMGGGYGMMGGGYGMMQEYGGQHGWHHDNDRHQAMWGQGYGPGAAGAPCAANASGQPITASDAKAFVEQRLARHGDSLLQVGPVTEEDGKIVVSIVTKDGEKLVHKMEFDAKTGFHRRVN